MRVELHILQNFPPSNLNRDDTGSPKDTDFGGYRRARISSQCLKRNIRWSNAFASEVEGRIAIRTKRSWERVAEILQKQHEKLEYEAAMVAKAVIGKLIGAADAQGKTSVLYYVGNDELGFLAQEIAKRWEEIAPTIPTEGAKTDTVEKPTKGAKKKAEKQAESALTEAVQPIANAYKKRYEGKVNAIDIALFGRMLADDPTLNIDASCQVAHALSTNRVSMDFDYFTAVDDLKPEDTSGAEMIGTIGFNSSCFYRYAVIDVNQLAGNLGADDKTVGYQPALDGIRGFIKGSIEAIPTGKQNSFAARTFPSLVMAVVRSDNSQPMSLANAFERPIYPSQENSLVAGSIKALDKHWEDLNQMYGLNGASTFVTVLKDVDRLSNLANNRCDSIEELLERTMLAINEAWEKEAKK